MFETRERLQEFICNHCNIKKGLAFKHAVLQFCSHGPFDNISEFLEASEEEMYAMREEGVISDHPYKWLFRALMNCKGLKVDALRLKKHSRLVGQIATFELHNELISNGKREILTFIYNRHCVRESNSIGEAIVEFIILSPFDSLSDFLHAEISQLLELQDQGIFSNTRHRLLINTILRSKKVLNRETQKAFRRNSVAIAARTQYCLSASDAVAYVAEQKGSEAAMCIVSTTPSKIRKSSLRELVTFLQRTGMTSATLCSDSAVCLKEQILSAYSSGMCGELGKWDIYRLIMNFKKAAEPRTNISRAYSRNTTRSKALKSSFNFNDPILSESRRHLLEMLYNNCPIRSGVTIGKALHHFVVGCPFQSTREFLNAPLSVFEELRQTGIISTEINRYVYGVLTQIRGVRRKRKHVEMHKRIPKQMTEKSTPMHLLNNDQHTLLNDVLQCPVWNNVRQAAVLALAYLLLHNPGMINVNDVLECSNQTIDAISCLSINQKTVLITHLKAHKRYLYPQKFSEMHSLRWQERHKTLIHLFPTMEAILRYHPKIVSIATDVMLSTSIDTCRQFLLWLDSEVVDAKADLISSGRHPDRVIRSACCRTLRIFQWMKALCFEMGMSLHKALSPHVASRDEIIDIAAQLVAIQHKKRRHSVCRVWDATHGQDTFEKRVLTFYNRRLRRGGFTEMKSDGTVAIIDNFQISRVVMRRRINEVCMAYPDIFSASSWDKVIIQPRTLLNDNELQQLWDRNAYCDRACLFLSLLMDVALRAETFETCLVSSMWDCDSQAPKSLCAVLEKNSKYRIFRAPVRVYNALRRYMLSRNVPFKSSDYLFVRQRSLVPNERVGVGFAGAYLKRLSMNADVRNVNPHCFRHMLVNKHMRNGGRLEDISKYLGHSSSTTTDRHYWIDTDAALRSPLETLTVAEQQGKTTCQPIAPNRGEQEKPFWMA